MTRRMTDGGRIAQRMAKNWALGGEHVSATATVIDRIILRRMAEAWGEGWFAASWDKKRVNDNPYRGRRKK